MAQDYYLCIDIGTGSVRAALVGLDGRIRFIAAYEHEQIVPRHGWSEQRPADWWTGTATVVRQAMDKLGELGGRIAMVAADGQMHGTVLLGDDGKPTRETAPLWNDKRTLDYVRDFEAKHPPQDYLQHSANPPTPAWPGFKLQWLRDNDAEAYARATAVLMPKDYINFRLTGQRAQDPTETGSSFLMDPGSRDWSPEMGRLLGVDIAKLPPIRPSTDILGKVTAEAARETGLAEGTPVICGGGDYPLSLLGSGVCRPGLGSDVTGTSCIITLIADKPLIDAEISNVGTAEGGWGAFVLLETGGDAMRWIRRALHAEKIPYPEIDRIAGEAPAGSDGLFFLPYLTGERFGAHRNARAQYFGLSAGHAAPHLHRAVLEGVAFAAGRHMRIMEKAAGVTLERIVASSGGAKSDLWLQIKASAWNLPLLVPEELECSTVGCAILAATANGQFSSVQQAAEAFVRYDREVQPNPQWVERYAAMQPFFDRLYRHSQSLYDDLDSVVASLQTKT